MITCNNCGQQNSEGNYICSRCGHIVTSKSKKPVKPDTKNNTNQQNNNINQNSANKSSTNIKYTNKNNNINEKFSKQMYQQQAYGIVPNSKRSKYSKKITITIAAIVIILFIVIITIIIRNNNDNEVLQTSETDGFVINTMDEEIDESKYFYETQEVFNECGIIISTDLSKSVIDKNIELLLTIENNNSIDVNMEITDIKINAKQGNNICKDNILISSNSKEYYTVRFELDKKIKDDISTVEFNIHMYSNDNDVIIKTDECMIKDLETAQPVVLKAYIISDESIITNINPIISDISINNVDVKVSTIGNLDVGTLDVFGTNWKESMITDENSSHTLNKYQYEATYNNKDNIRSLYIINIEYLSNDIDEQYKKLLDSTNIDNAYEYHGNNTLTKYNIIYKSSEFIMTSLTLDYNTNSIITILYQENNSSTEEFNTAVNKLFETYSKCDLSGIKL